METPADAMAEAMGVGKSSVWWWRLTAVSACISTIGLAAWLSWEIKSEPTVLPYVLLLDDETRVLDSIRAKEWQPGAAVYADVATRSSRRRRSRSTTIRPWSGSSGRSASTSEAATPAPGSASTERSP